MEAKVSTLQHYGFGRMIPFAAGRQVFQYVESFRDAMVADARRGGLDRAQLETVADLSSKWVLQNGLLEQALEGRNEFAAEAISRIDLSAWPGGHAEWYMSLFGQVGEAIRRLDAFDWEGAESAFQNDSVYLQTAEFWPFVTVARMRSRLAQGRGHAEALRVQDVLASTPPPPGIGANHGTELLHTELALLWISVGDPVRARKVIDAFKSPLSQAAPARMLLPHEDRERARSVAERNGIGLDSFLPDSLPVPFAFLPDAVVLTEREHHVLRALAALVSSASVPTTAQIAAQLFVSTNTLKTQLRSLYRKLGADSRETAIRRAHKLELL